MFSIQNLKPCPFCGSSKLNVSKLDYNSNSYTYFVECESCGLTGPINTDAISETNAKQLAAEVWNNRVSITKRNTYTCPFCGYDNYNYLIYYIGDKDILYKAAVAACDGCGTTISPYDASKTEEDARQAAKTMWYKLCSGVYRQC